MSRKELGALICEALVEALDDSPVLVGGAAAMIDSGGRYVSYDLDFVTYRDRKRLTPVMERLGFRASGAHFTHPNTKLWVQFISAPPMIGKKYIKTPARIATRAGTLRIISALDAACDRLDWFLDGDAPSLDQCANVVAAQKIPLAKIRAWLANEDWPLADKARALDALTHKLRRRHRATRRRAQA